MTMNRVRPGTRAPAPSDAPWFPPRGCSQSEQCGHQRQWSGRREAADRIFVAEIFRPRDVYLSVCPNVRGSSLFSPSMVFSRGDANAARERGSSPRCARPSR